MIQVKWKKLLSYTVMWLVTEIILNCLGLDNLADYSEYIYSKYDLVGCVTKNWARHNNPLPI